MEIKGKVKICNKWIDGELDKSAYDFENRGTYAFGTLQWTDVKKGKNGDKDEFTNTKKKFILFDSGFMDLIEQTLGNQIEIEGKLEGSKYADKKTGEVKNSEQIKISKVSVVEKEISQHSKDKGNAYINDVSDDEIPF